jgi:hypothetical protein
LNYLRRNHFVWFAKEQELLKWKSLLNNVFFVQAPEKIHLPPGFRVLCVAERELITAKATLHAYNAKGMEKQAMDCHAHVVEAKDLFSEN